MLVVRAFTILIFLQKVEGRSKDSKLICTDTDVIVTMTNYTLTPVYNVWILIMQCPYQYCRWLTKREVNAFIICFLSLF